MEHRGQAQVEAHLGAFSHRNGGLELEKTSAFYLGSRKSVNVDG